MTEIQVTDGLIEAAKEVSVDLARGGEVTRTSSQYIATILAALPKEVTNPKPGLPTVDGWYISGGYYPPIKLVKGTWLWSNGVAEDYPENLLPLTRLVPEKPPLTYSEILSVVTSEWHNEHGTSNMATKIMDYVNGNRA